MAWLGAHVDNRQRVGSRARVWRRRRDRDRAAAAAEELAQEAEHKPGRRTPWQALCVHLKVQPRRAQWAVGDAPLGEARDDGQHVPFDEVAKRRAVVRVRRRVVEAQAEGRTRPASPGVIEA